MPVIDLVTQLQQQTIHIRENGIELEVVMRMVSIIGK